MREPSASLLGLVPHCAHPFDSGTPWPEDRSDASDFGKRVHLACEALGRPQAAFPGCFGGLSDSERDRLIGCVEQARSYLATLPPATIETEIRLRYDVAAGTARRVLNRFERRAEGEQTAILDHVRISPDELHVIDWKTGGGTRDRAADNWQLRLQALAGAAAFGVRRVRAELVTLERDGYDVDGVTWSRWDLGALAAELRKLRERWTGGPTPPTPGSHCTTRFCPLRGVCSATAAALATVIEPGRPVPREIENDADARYVTELLPLAEAALAGLKARRDEYARRRPFEVGGGLVFGWRQHETRSVKCDTEEQRIAVASVLGDHAYRHAIKVSHDITIGGIEKAASEKLREAGQAKGKSALVKQALAALEKVGGYRVSTWEKAEAFKQEK